MADKVMVFILCGFLLIGTSGCIALIAGAVGAGGTALWLNGKVIQEVDVDIHLFLITVRAISMAQEGLQHLHFLHQLHLGLV